MTGEAQGGICGKCGHSLDEVANLPLEQRESCPACGSLIKALHVSVCESVSLHESLDMVNRDEGGKKLSHARFGDDFHRDTKTWRYLERVIDWGKKWYYEKVSSKETGEVFRHVDEPLANHTGRGSAKKPPQ